MRQLILYGAFDRYNYGDNLMPIVFTDYLQQNAAHQHLEIIYSSIKDSDLTRYACKSTRSITKVMKSIKANSGLVVVGGEVLCARNDALFLHTLDNVNVGNALRWLNKRSHKSLRRIANIAYSTPWDFPYQPDPDSFTQPLKIAYNSVGGSLTGGLGPREQERILMRLAKSEHFSVRDERTFNSFTSRTKTHLVPDSVILLSTLYKLSEIKPKVRHSIQEITNDSYIVIQAAPAKAEAKADVIAKQIELLYGKTGLKTVLLPIGYASGHDDFTLLKKIHELKPKITKMAWDLTLWEILYVIANARIYYGTSLHGAITAMSYGIPHFGLNPQVHKLNSYLAYWGVEPFNRCVDFSEIFSVYRDDYGDSLAQLHQKTKATQRLASNNIDEIMQKLFPY